MAEVNDKIDEDSISKKAKSKTVFENSVRKYPVIDEGKFSSIKYENEENFDDVPEETEEEEEKPKTTELKSTVVTPLKPVKGSPKPYFETKPSLIPETTKKDEKAKKPELVTTPLGNPNYRFAGKESFLQFIKNNLPKEFYPTARIAPILGFIFLGVLLIGLALFGVNEMSSMFSTHPDTEMEIKVGLPMSFLVFDAGNPEAFPLKILGFIVDLLLYVLLAYAIDVGINYAHSQAKSLTIEERKKHPKIYKIKQENTLAEKITKKLFDDY